MQLQRYKWACLSHNLCEYKAPLCPYNCAHWRLCQCKCFGTKRNKRRSWRRGAGWGRAGWERGAAAASRLNAQLFWGLIYHSCLDLERKIEREVEFISAAEIGVTGSVSLLELQWPEDGGTGWAAGQERSLLAQRHGKGAAGSRCQRNTNHGKESDAAWKKRIQSCFTALWGCSNLCHKAMLTAPNPGGPGVRGSPVLPPSSACRGLYLRTQRVGFPLSNSVVICTWASFVNCLCSDWREIDIPKLHFISS